MASNGRRNGPGRPAGAKKDMSRPPAAGRKPRSRTASSASVRPTDGTGKQASSGDKAAGVASGAAVGATGGAGDGPNDSRAVSTSSSGGDSSWRRSPVTKRAAVLALVIAALVVSYASSLRAWVDQRSAIGELEQSVSERRHDVGELERELDRWDDPAYVKAQARERFGWVMPGETGYVVVGRDGRTPNAEPEPEGDPQPKAPWWQTLWGSVETAGDPPPSSETDQDKPRQPAEKIGP